MRGEIGKTFNMVLTTIMLVIVLIACERMPDSQTIEPQPTQNSTNNS